MSKLWRVRRSARYGIRDDETLLAGDEGRKDGGCEKLIF